MSSAVVISPPGLSRETLTRFCRFITSELGIKMSEAKLPMLQSRLQRRLRVLNLGSLDEYQEYLFNGPRGEEERVHFINAITTNKTDFFREPKHFEYLVQTALPALDRNGRQAGPNRPWRFKLWCAGCATGEEPYTLSMVLSEYRQRRPAFDFSLLATDISTRALAYGQAGIYDQERIEPIAPALRSKYLLRSSDPSRAQVRIIPELRRHVSFHRLNFMDATYPVKDTFEVIFFRNVMIYFDKATQESVIQKLCRSLAPGGYLFVGHSESLAGLNIPVTAVATAVYRKPA